MILLGDNRKIKSEIMQRRQYETQDADMIHDCTLADLTIVAPTVRQEPFQTGFEVHGLGKV